MPRTRHWRSSAWMAALALLALAPTAPGATPAVTEFRLSLTGSSPRGIATGWDGNLWFTQHGRNALGRIAPTASSGTQVTEHSFGVPGDGAYGAEGIAAGPDGRLWFALNEGAEPSFWIGSMTQGAIPGAALYELSAADPRPSEVAAGRDGRLWFTRGGATNSIGRISPFSPYADGQFAIPTVPTTPTPSKGIAAGPDGNLWFTWQGRVGRATTGTSPAIETFATGATPQQIAAGPDGNLWFTQTGPDAVSRITPGGVVTAFPLPATFGSAAGIAAGPDGNLWFTEGDGGALGRISPQGDEVAIQGSIATFPSPTAPAFVARRIAAGPDGNLWFTGSDAAGHKVGRITTALEPPQARTPLGGSPIAVPSFGSAEPYPSSLNLAGIPGPVGSVRVYLYGLFHAWPEDLDLLLVGPQGHKAMVLSDVGADRSVFGTTLTIDDTAPFAAPAAGILASGRYRPLDREPGEDLPAPAPPGPYGADLSAFDGTDPNGAWRLYVADDSSGYAGRLLGWGLRVTPASPAGEEPGGGPLAGGESPGGEGSSTGGGPPPGGGGPRLPGGAGFVAGTRQVLVDTRGRALVELTCPAALGRTCVVDLSGATTGPLLPSRGRGRRGRPAFVPRRRFAVPSGRVRVAPLPLPARLRRVLGPRAPRLRLVAEEGGAGASLAVVLRPAMAEVRAGRDGRVRILLPHAGDARRLDVRLVQGSRTLARGLVARPRRGLVVPARIRLTRKPRGGRPVRVEVTTVPVEGAPRLLAYRVRPPGAGA